MTKPAEHAASGRYRWGGGGRIAVGAGAFAPLGEKTALAQGGCRFLFAADAAAAVAAVILGEDVEGWLGGQLASPPEAENFYDVSGREVDHPSRCAFRRSAPYL